MPRKRSPSTSCCAPSAKPSSRPPSLTNVHFPGQYFDAEDNLCQNGFRDYDPSVGRYIQTDPIGNRDFVRHNVTSKLMAL